jgi:flavorubredoxin
MQVASMAPIYKTEADIPADELNHEKELQSQMMKDDPKMAGKPEKVLEGILAGKVKKHFKDLCLADQEFNVITTGDTLDLGGKTFTFINAPMLHWPDSNFTLYNEEGILFSNDAFGQHICESKRYDVDVDPAYLALHAKKFYANLVQLSASMVLNKVAE